MRDRYDVVVLGAGAAGIGAGRRLAAAGASFLLLEARERIGGRAWSVDGLDLGCGWLHSADRNALAAMADGAGLKIDTTPAPWRKQSGKQGLSAAEQQDFAKTFARFEKRIDAEAEEDNPPRPASVYLEPGSRWTPMLNAVFSYISGATLDCIDAVDYARYEDTGVNWRVREGYGALIAALGADLPVSLCVRAEAVEHGADRVCVRTAQGSLEARAVIVTLPTTSMASLTFRPALPEKLEAAASLPLGAAEKLYFALAQPEEFEHDGHFFARFDSADTGSYHVNPMGRPLLEVYFGGGLARELAEAGGAAMADFAKQELAGLLGSQFPSRLALLGHSSWATDPLALGSYSYARPGCADARQTLAAACGMIFFAGEACSRARYSTAHGAFETGYQAAELALGALQAPP
ncbi:MAG: flavin monoamine oxidase family protein [Hyphomonadaceae bacterium]